MNAIAFSKAVHYLITMLIYPFYKVRCHSNIERSIALAGKHVNARLFIHAGGLFTSLWTGFRQSMPE